MEALQNYFDLYDYEVDHADDLQGGKISRALEWSTSLAYTPKRALHTPKKSHRTIKKRAPKDLKGSRMVDCIGKHTQKSPPHTQKEPSHHQKRALEIRQGSFFIVL